MNEAVVALEKELWLLFCCPFRFIKAERSSLCYTSGIVFLPNIRDLHILISPFISTNQNSKEITKMSKIINALDEQFHIDCEVVETKYEYPQYTGIEKWIIITDLTVEELESKYAEQIALLKPFIVLSRSFGQVRDDYIRNENKHAMRASRSIEPFDYDDELCAAFHPELISNSMEIEFIHLQECKELQQAISKLGSTQKNRLIKYFFNEMTYREIAEQEGVAVNAVAKSVVCAINNLKKLLS